MGKGNRSFLKGGACYPSRPLESWKLGFVGLLLKEEGTLGSHFWWHLVLSLIGQPENTEVFPWPCIQRFGIVSSLDQRISVMIEKHCLDPTRMGVESREWKNNSVWPDFQWPHAWGPSHWTGKLVGGSLHLCLETGFFCSSFWNLNQFLR